MINQEEYEILKDLDDRLGWLARDRDGDLVAYEKKPEKSTRFWFDNGRIVNLGVIFDVGRLFQFIQWEGEEPYLVSDLINEYEKSQVYEIFNRQLEILYEESEEIEVKKDKDWLKEQIEELDGDGSDVTFNKGYEFALDRVRYLVDHQLDESEVLPQELPVIPKYVADWIVDLKSKNIHLLDSIYDFTHGEDIHDYMREQSNVLMRAWLDGFTIANEDEELWKPIENYEEEEPLYRARLRVITDGSIASYLRTQSSDAEDRLKVLEIGSKYIHEDYRHLSEFTENELKRLDIWDSEQWEIEEVE